jgi:hypothetical protein
MTSRLATRDGRRPKRDQQDRPAGEPEVGRSNEEGAQQSRRGLRSDLTT